MVPRAVMSRFFSRSRYLISSWVVWAWAAAASSRPAARAVSFSRGRRMGATLDGRSAFRGRRGGVTWGGPHRRDQPGGSPCLCERRGSSPPLVLGLQGVVLLLQLLLLVEQLLVAGLGGLAHLVLVGVLHVHDEAGRRGDAVAALLALLALRPLEVAADHVAVALEVRLPRRRLAHVHLPLERLQNLVPLRRGPAGLAARLGEQDLLLEGVEVLARPRLGQDRRQELLGLLDLVVQPQLADVQQPAGPVVLHLLGVRLLALIALRLLDGGQQLDRLGVPVQAGVALGQQPGHLRRRVLLGLAQLVQQGGEL